MTEEDDKAIFVFLMIHKGYFLKKSSIASIYQTHFWRSLPTTDTVKQQWIAVLPTGQSRKKRLQVIFPSKSPGQGISLNVIFPTSYWKFTKKSDKELIISQPVWISDLLFKICFSALVPVHHPLVFTSENVLICSDHTYNNFLSFGEKQHLGKWP